MRMEHKVHLLILIKINYAFKIAKWTHFSSWIAKQTFLNLCSEGPKSDNKSFMDHNEPNHMFLGPRIPLLWSESEETEFKK